LIRDFLAGEREAFDELVVRHRKQILATAYRMVSNAETTWLYRITMNLCYNELKKRKREAELEPGPGIAKAELPHESLVKEERKVWLRRQMELLPFKQKSTLALRIFQDMSFKEIGRAIGCSAGSARVNYRHAILKLKDALASSGEEL